MKRLLIFALIAALFLPMMGQEESRILLGNLMKPKVPSYALNLNQNLLTTSSPTFAGLTLSGGTASTLAYLNASKAFTSLANGSGYLLNDGSGGLSWGALDLSPYVKKDGSTELTADWNVGAFDLTAVDMTATNFKLSGTGTLTSALGNVSLTTALTAATGDEVGFLLSPTINKAAGNYTGIKLNVTETSAPGTSDLLLDLQVATVSKFKVANDGTVTIPEGGYYNSGTNYTIVRDDSRWKISGLSGVRLQAILDRAAGNMFEVTGSTTSIELTDTDGSQAWLYIGPNINQSGTAGYQAVKINVTETALGSGATGANRLFTAQVGSVEKAAIDNKGAITSTMINNADSDTDEIDSVDFAGGYGMVIAASTTDGTSAIWKLKGTTFEAIEVDADWTATKDGAGTYNVYIESGAIKLQNKVGDDKSLRLGFFWHLKGGSAHGNDYGYDY